MSKLSVTKVYQLGLMTVAYIVGELTHFLINTTSKAQVRETESRLLNHNGTPTLHLIRRGRLGTGRSPASPMTQ